MKLILFAFFVTVFIGVLSFIVDRIDKREKDHFEND